MKKYNTEVPIKGKYLSEIIEMLENQYTETNLTIADFLQCDKETVSKNLMSKVKHIFLPSRGLRNEGKIYPGGIYYDKGEVLEYIKNNTTASIKTVKIDLLQYIPEKSRMDFIIEYIDLLKESQKKHMQKYELYKRFENLASGYIKQSEKGAALLLYAPNTPSIGNDLSMPIEYTPVKQYPGKLARMSAISQHSEEQRRAVYYKGLIKFKLCGITYVAETETFCEDDWVNTGKYKKILKDYDILKFEKLVLYRDFKNGNCFKKIK